MTVANIIIAGVAYLLLLAVFMAVVRWWLP